MGLLGGALYSIQVSVEAHRSGQTSKGRLQWMSFLVLIQSNPKTKNVKQILDCSLLFITSFMYYSPNTL